MIISSLKEKGCLIKGDKDVLGVSDSIELASNVDWSTEYLDKIVSIKTIKGGVEEAVNHVNIDMAQVTQMQFFPSVGCRYQFLNNVAQLELVHA